LLFRFSTMILASLLPAASLAAGLAGPSLVVALATAPLQNVPDASGPTAIEQALTERACAGAQSAGTVGYDVHGACLSARLVTLRSEFGKNLSRLSPVQRKKLDSACSHLQTISGREAYLDCLHSELASLPGPHRAAASVAPLPVVAAAPVGAPDNSVATLLPTSFPLGSATALVASVAGALALVYFVVKASRPVPPLTCRVCSVPVPGPGDVCVTCRHGAAEALRHAAADREDRQRAVAEDAQRQRDHADQQHQRKVRAGEEARLRHLEETRRSEQDTRQREEDARKDEQESRRLPAEEPEHQPAAASDTGEPAFDPHLVLGVALHSTEQQLRAAFEEARSKYDPEQVSHLGVDVQEHFAEKSRAVERAYRMLAGDIEPPAPDAGGDPAPATALVS